MKVLMKDKSIHQIYEDHIKGFPKATQWAIVEILECYERYAMNPADHTLYSAEYLRMDLMAMLGFDPDGFIPEWIDYILPVRPTRKLAEHIDFESNRPSLRKIKWFRRLTR